MDPKYPMIITLLVMFPAAALGQRDAPVWESNLTRISVYHNNRTSCTVELDYKKEGGHYVHNVHQLYLFIYLSKDEEEIMKLTAEKADLNKKDLPEKSLVDRLIEKKLVKVLETKAEKVHPLNVENQHDRRNHVYSFKFPFENKALFEAVAKLVNFDPDNVKVSGGRHDYEDKFKLMAFVPVNTSPYATKIPKKLRKQYDFTNNVSLEGHYFRSLPYVLYLARFGDDFLLYVN